MKRLKYLFVGLLAGILVATAGQSFAASVIEKVTATVRADYSVELDGKKAELKNAPLAYDGNSYLPVREIANLLGKDVDFEDGVIKLDTPKEADDVTDITLDLDEWTSLDQLRLNGHEVRIGIGLIPNEPISSSDRLATVTYYLDGAPVNKETFIVPDFLLEERIFLNENNTRLLFKDGSFFLENSFLDTFLN